MIRSILFNLCALLVGLSFSMESTSVLAQESGDPDRIRFRFGADHGLGVGVGERHVTPSTCTEPCAFVPSFDLRYVGYFPLHSMHGSVRFGMQFNRYFALSLTQSIWAIPDHLLGSSQLMAEWMPLDILQLGIAAGYDYPDGNGGLSGTLRAALNLSGRRSGARRDGLMVVFTSHATVLFHQRDIPAIRHPGTL